MMNLLTALSSLGLGAFFGAIASRLLDILQERRRQRFELQLRLFELKIDATLRCVKTAKYGSSVFVTIMKSLEELFATPLSQDTSAALSLMLTAEVDRATKDLETLTKDSLGTDSLLAFFYGERLQEIIGTQEDQLSAVRAKLLSVFDEMQKVGDELNRANQSGDTSKEDILALLKRFVALRRPVNDLRLTAEALDANSNNLIALLRREYKSLGL